MIVENHVDDVIRAKNEAVDRALEMIGIKAEGYAKRLCPVDTGLLRNSITHAVAGGSSSISSYKGSSKHGNTPTTVRNKVAGKPAPPPHEGTYSGSIGDSEEKAVYIGTNVEYAPYVEMGTSRTKAQPYLKPAVANHVDVYRRILESELKG